MDSIESTSISARITAGGDPRRRADEAMVGTRSAPQAETSVTPRPPEQQAGVQLSPKEEDFRPYGPDGERRPINRDSRGGTAPSGADAPRVSEQASVSPQTGKTAAGEPGSEKNPVKQSGKPEGTPLAGSSTSKGLQDPQVQAEIARLKSTEEKVKSHEAAHKAAGGTMTGPISYTYTRGPDGKNYITGGEVPIRMTSGKTPQETISRMQQVIQAAMAPADPSPQDRSVAAQASSLQQRARMEMSTSTSGENSQAAPEAAPGVTERSSRAQEPSGTDAGALPGNSAVAPRLVVSDSRSPEVSSAEESGNSRISRKEASAGSAESARQREISSAASDAARVPAAQQSSAIRSLGPVSASIVTLSLLSGSEPSRPVSRYA